MTWRFAAAARAGTSHEREQLPCQDSYQCSVAPTPAGDAFVAVVADGAGSAAESARGSALICRRLTAHITADLHEVEADGAETWLRQRLAGTRADLLAEADSLGLPPRQLAATLLCAVLAPGWSVFAQVGDGAIVTPEVGTDQWNWLFWPQRGEYANTTSFFSDDNALDNIEVGVTGPQPEVALFTDGLQHLLLHYEQQTVHSPFFERMLRPVRQSDLRPGENNELSGELYTYLGSAPVTSRADDDLTLVLGTRLVPQADADAR
jgi:hypothetical protein